MSFTRLATFLSVTAFSASAFAYDFSCYPETVHDPSLLAPNVGFMLDQSGSMGLSTNPSNPTAPSRWAAARTAILEVVQDYYVAGACPTGTEAECDLVRFGLGKFSEDDFTTDWFIPVQEDAHAVPFTSQLPVAEEGAFTHTGDGAEAMVAESSLNDSMRANVGIFITDGLTVDEDYTYGESRDQVVRAVLALCSGRTRANPLVTYFIAFGSDAQGTLNDLYAAAGGTGTCVDSMNNAIDVCSLDYAGVNNLLRNFDEPVFGAPSADVDPNRATCTGSKLALTPTDLKNEITTITTEAACTFPLDIPAGYPGGTALADSDATNVTMNHSTFGNITLGNIGDCDMPSGTVTENAVTAATGDATQGAAYTDEGWCFADTTRLRVRLTAGLCGEITGGTIDTVTTQVACSCALVGQPCTITGLSCIDESGGTSICTNEQLMNMPCSSGVYQCVTGTDVCVATGAGVLPEICNGVDDNCDGLTDNVADTESDWSDPSVADGKHCNFDNTCQCPSGMRENITTDGSLNTLLTTNYTGVCVCGSSLEYEDETTAGNDSEPQSDAACASFGGIQHALLIWGVLLAFVFGFRRRRA